MPTEREKLEQELLEQAQKAIKKMLDELPEATDITLSDMEEATGVMGRSIMNQSLQKLAQEKQVVPSTSKGSNGVTGRHSICIL